MQKTFITSDPHFGHSNIIEYAQRPFKDKYEMGQPPTTKVVGFTENRLTKINFFASTTHD